MLSGDLLSVSHGNELLSLFCIAAALAERYDKHAPWWSQPSARDWYYTDAVWYTPRCDHLHPDLPQDFMLRLYACMYAEGVMCHFEVSETLWLHSQGMGESLSRLQQSSSIR